MTNHALGTIPLDELTNITGGTAMDGCKTGIGLGGAAGALVGGAAGYGTAVVSRGRLPVRETMLDGAAIGLIAGAIPGCVIGAGVSAAADALRKR